MKTTRTVKKSLLLNEATKSNLSIKDLNNVKGGEINPYYPLPYYETIPPGGKG